jgi:hypothetical protein
MANQSRVSDRSSDDRCNRYDLVSDEQMEWLRELRANRKVLEDGLGELTQPFAGVTRSAMNARDVVVRRK